ncbi:MAG: methanethiol S-methyltransferase [Tahibacter sp.]
MQRLAILLYGIVCYIVFFATFLYAVGFIGNFLAPKSIDGPASGDWMTSLLVDVGLLLVFAAQHSVMARPAFKRWWTRFVPEVAERSTYVLMSSVALIVLFLGWRPLGGTIWSATQPWLVNLLYAGFAFGWLLVLVTTFLINHFDLFGLRQVWLNFRGQPYTRLSFVTPGPYRWVRHPLYVGWLFAFWCIPLMTATHLLFALATTAYILLAIGWEERDLVAAMPEYSAYQKQVPMLIPRLSKPIPDETTAPEIR